MLSISAIRSRGSIFSSHLSLVHISEDIHQNSFPSLGVYMNCHSSAEKLIVNFSKEMLILQPRFYILNFNETKSVNSLSSDKQLKFKLAVYLGGKVMVSTQSSNLVRTHSLLMIRSFLIWTFTLAVCLC